MFVLLCVSIGTLLLGCCLLGVGASLAYLGTAAWAGDCERVGAAWTDNCERISAPLLLVGSGMVLLGAVLFVVDMGWWFVAAALRLLFLVW